MSRPDEVDHLVGRLSDIGRGGRLRSRGMRVEDAQQIQPLGFNPIEGPDLFIRIHHESHRTLGLIPYKQHFLHPIIFTGQQPAGFQWSVLINMFEHFVPVAFTEDQVLLHYY